MDITYPIILIFLIGIVCLTLIALFLVFLWFVEIHAFAVTKVKENGELEKFDETLKRTHLWLKDPLEKGYCEGKQHESEDKTGSDG